MAKKAPFRRIILPNPKIWGLGSHLRNAGHAQAGVGNLFRTPPFQGGVPRDSTQNQIFNPAVNGGVCIKRVDLSAFLVLWQLVEI